MNTSLHDEKTFYKTFLKDLERCNNEVIIESPFITSARMKTYWPIFRKLYDRGVKIYIITRDPKEHNQGYEVQSESEIRKLEILGIQVLLCTGNHHRKLAIIDREILWEGSLNILSQIHSREFMRRLEGGRLRMKMLYFGLMTNNSGYLINEQDIASALFYLTTNGNKNATKEDAIKFLEENVKMSHIIAQKVVADEQNGKIKKVNLNNIK